MISVDYRLIYAALMKQLRSTIRNVLPVVVSWPPGASPTGGNWTNTVLGTLRLEAGRLVADVNSARRADRLIARRLGQTAILIETTVVDPSEAIEEGARQRAAGERHDEPPPDRPAELQEIEEEMSRQQWVAWLDTRVPALGNKTPRQAARTVRGRERLEALLAEFDRHDMDGPSGIAPHLAAIRDALALTKPPGSGEDTR